MKKGFTLIELLAVIILLAIIALIAYPTLNNVISKNKDKLYDKQISELERHANTWIMDHAETFELENGEYYSLTFEEMYNSGLLNSKEVKDPRNSENLPGCVLINKNGINYDINYSETCNPYPDLKEYFAKDNSGANSPDLLDKMVPIVYTGTKWIATDKNQEKWYSYDEKAWANAVILNDGISKTAGQEVTEEDIALWYVWIPRYKYQLFNALGEAASEQVINVTFESNSETTGTVSCTDAINQTDSNGNLISEVCTNATNGNWYTHPGFTFDNKELTGFWMGKFKMNVDDKECTDVGSLEKCNKESKVYMKPNVPMWLGSSLANYHKSAQLINSFYGINDADNHVTKNMEWGATFYLKQSKYGLGITALGKNNHISSTLSAGPRNTGCGVAHESAQSKMCDPYDTANGMLASTTGNIYGVYDMDSERAEYVMAHMVATDGSFYIGYISPSDDYIGFATAIDSKYYDAYSYTSYYTNRHATRGKLGDATKEIVKAIDASNYPTEGWYDASVSIFVYGSDAWLGRINMGYCTVGNLGIPRTARAVMVRK